MFAVKNRHHTALFVQNNQLKLLLRKGPLTTNDKTAYESEWIWKLAQINDDQWHSYKFVVSYPKKVSYSPHRASWYSFISCPRQIDLYVDDKLFVPISENFQVINDHALAVIDGTEDTIFALGACWHGKKLDERVFCRELSRELKRSSSSIVDRAANLKTILTLVDVTLSFRIHVIVTVSSKTLFLRCLDIEMYSATMLTSWLDVFYLDFISLSYASRETEKKQTFVFINSPE